MLTRSLALCLCLTGCYDRTLEQDELAGLFTDATVEGSHDDYSFKRKFHADGRFAQWLGDSPAIDATGTWSVSADRLCMQWDKPHPKAGELLCHAVKTDDKGRYWKELPEGYTVEYRTIVDVENKGRFKIPGTSTRRWRWMTTWRGALVCLPGILFLFLLWRRFRAQAPEPSEPSEP